jgi:hypothetical protein
MILKTIKSYLNEFDFNLFIKFYFLIVKIQDTKSNEFFFQFFYVDNNEILNDNDLYFFIKGISIEIDYLILDFLIIFSSLFNMLSINNDGLFYQIY